MGARGAPGGGQRSAVDETKVAGTVPSSPKRQRADDSLTKLEPETSTELAARAAVERGPAEGSTPVTCASTALVKSRPSVLRLFFSQGRRASAAPGHLR